jgi:TfoX/Sxy family transcriptional regulator of competence genes
VTVRLIYDRAATAWLKIPRADSRSESFFRSLVPKGANITTKLMFGNVAAFLNGNLFMGLYGNDFLLRLPEKEVLALIEGEGASRFEPVKGRVMKGYVLVPRSWWKEAGILQTWIKRSMELAGTLPPKRK